MVSTITSALPPTVPTSRQGVHDSGCAQAPANEVGYALPDARPRWSERVVCLFGATDAGLEMRGLLLLVGASGTDACHCRRGDHIKSAH
jgi:hypothetical protein